MDEGPEEQGVAHFVEHVTFLGSRKRENLLGTGCRSNAYTDFQHTVFHVHLPLSNGNTGRPMLPQVSLGTMAVLLPCQQAVQLPGPALLIRQPLKSDSSFQRPRAHG